MTQISCHSVEPQEIESLRAAYRREMDCQIIHESIHTRPGWTREFLLTEAGAQLGYASTAVAGPWEREPALYEFYLLPVYRCRSFQLFQEILSVAGAKVIETQSNDPHLTAMLFCFAKEITSEAILFEDSQTTSLAATAGAKFRSATSTDQKELVIADLDAGAKWLLEVGGQIAAAGDILYHYNPPYGDIYMKVAARFRRRGLGSYVVQELKRVCREAGNVPAARCNPSNIASRQTLQRAGFAPCGHLLRGQIAN